MDMKQHNNIKLICIIVLFLTTSMFVYGQSDEESDDTPMPEPGSAQTLTPQEQIDFRNKILDIFGIPHNVPLSLLDIMNGKMLGIKPDLGPLSNLKIVTNKNSREPGDEIQAVAVATGVDMANATITWYHNNKKIISGKGKTTYQFILGKVGANDTLRVVVTTTAGTTNEAIEYIYPARIHLTWSTQGYTPSWYRGKALPLPGSTISFTAIPDVWVGGTRVSPTELTYTWSVDGYSAKKGKGLNSFDLKMARSASVSYTIEVGISSDNKRITHSKFFYISTSEPTLVFYEKDALMGVKANQAIKSASLADGEIITFQLEPFYLPLNELPTTEYQWSVNGGPIENNDLDNRTFRFVSEPGSSGSRTISVEFNNIVGVRRHGITRLDIIVPKKEN